MSETPNTAGGDLMEGASAFFQGITKALETQRNNAMSRVAELEVHASMLGDALKKANAAIASMQAAAADQQAASAAANVPPASGPVEAKPGP